MTVTVEFVEEIPRELEPDTVYVSIPFSIVVHSCFCGCGQRVVTPLSPVDWELTYDGETISLYPSIGNWDFPCMSHYWIQKNKVVWARKWSHERIERGRRRVALEKD